MRENNKCIIFINLTDDISDFLYNLSNAFYLDNFISVSISKNTNKKCIFCVYSRNCKMYELENLSNKISSFCIITNIYSIDDKLIDIKNNLKIPTFNIIKIPKVRFKNTYNFEIGNFNVLIKHPLNNENILVSSDDLLKFLYDNFDFNNEKITFETETNHFSKSKLKEIQSKFVYKLELIKKLYED